MYHFLYPSKDSTIYQYDKDRNVGSDEILELDRVDGEEARALIKFRLDSIRDFVSDSLGDAEAVLRLWTTEASNLPFEYDLACYPVTEPWVRGTGRASGVETEGVTWTSRGPEPWTFGGGDFDVTVSGRQSFEHEPADAQVDVTDLLSYWVSGGDNHGLAIIRENDTTRSSELKFFGSRTHTIYVPELVVRYDDSVFAPTDEQRDLGALNPELEDVQVQVKGRKPQYAPDGIKRFRVVARDRYQKQEFAEEIKKRTPRYLDGDLKYSIRDALNEKTLVPYSEASKLSFGRGGYYFDIDLRNVQPDRHYSLRFRYESPTGYTENFEGTEFIVDDD